jgi:hypothetical protein
MNNIKSHALVTDHGTQLINELTRTLAKVAARPLDNATLYTSPSNIDFEGLFALAPSYVEGMTRESAALRSNLSNLNFMIISDRGEVHIVLISQENYQLVRRPGMSVIKELSIAEALTRLATAADSQVQVDRSYTNQWLIHPTLTDEVLESGMFLRNYMNHVNRYLSYLRAKTPAGQPIPQTITAQVLSTEISGTDIISDMDPGIIRSLCAFGVLVEAAMDRPYWPFSRRDVWEELHRVASDYHSYSKFAMRIYPTANRLNNLQLEFSQAE